MRNRDVLLRVILPDSAAMVNENRVTFCVRHSPGGSGKRWLSVFSLAHVQNGNFDVFYYFQRTNWPSEAIRILKAAFWSYRRIRLRSTLPLFLYFILIPTKIKIIHFFFFFFFLMTRFIILLLLGFRQIKSKMWDSRIQVDSMTNYNLFLKFLSFH